MDMARIVYEGPVNVGTDLDDATEIDLQPGDGSCDDADSDCRCDRGG